MKPKAFIVFEQTEDHFLPWSMPIDHNNTIMEKSPYVGQTLIGFAPKGDLNADLVSTLDQDWHIKAKGLVPVLSEKGKWYQLTSHVVYSITTKV